MAEHKGSVILGNPMSSYGSPEVSQAEETEKAIDVASLLFGVEGAVFYTSLQNLRS
jgi:hypothetical protein